MFLNYILVGNNEFLRNLHTSNLLIIIKILEINDHDF